jgi:hypothetical protein
MTRVTVLPKTGNKFGARKGEYNGVVYDSLKEAAYRKTLEFLKHAHDPKQRVTQIEEQVPFNITIKGKHICTLILDFVVHYADMHVEYVDVKGYKAGAAYNVFRIKRDAVNAQYDITIKEV